MGHLTPKGLRNKMVLTVVNYIRVCNVGAVLSFHTNTTRQKNKKVGEKNYL